jgi:FkbH-like protein
MADRRSLYWLPVLPDWAVKFDAAVNTPEWTSLVALANHALSFRETLKLDQLLCRQHALVGTDVPTARIAILGSSTVDHLPAGIRVAMLRRGVKATTWVGDYGVTATGDVAAELDIFEPNVILFADDPITLARGVSPGLPLAEAETRMSAQVEALVARWDQATARHRAQVIQQLSPPATFPAVLGSSESQLLTAPATFIATLNANLRAASGRGAVDFLSLDDASARDGMDAWHDPVTWHRSKQFVAPRAVPLYGDLVARLIYARSGQSAKCLVLDLDNTLWGGVVGDDGLEGIVIGQGSAEGEAFTAFQHYAKQLGERGIILSVASKNDEANAREPFQRHPDMILRERDIASFQANWGSKAESLRAIAAELDIGIDSLVFVDDNPFERALVRELEPRAIVPEVGDDPSAYAQCLADAGYFESVALTEEDRSRGDLYATRAARMAAASGTADVASYLASLDMRLIWGRIDKLTLARSAQLIGKTNQFNLTTRRHGEADLTAMIDAPDYLPLQFRLVDRFGDNGLIAVVIGKCESKTLVIDTWLMSCRVLRRGVEEATLAIILAKARAIGCDYVRGTYLPTAKNGMVAGLYPSLGFREIAPAAKERPGATVWRIATSDPLPLTGAITLEPPL